MDIKGIVEVRVTDKDTGELKRTYNYENIVAIPGESRLRNNASLDYTQEPEGVTFYNEQRTIYISTGQYAPNVRSTYYIPYTVVPGTRQANPLWVDATTSPDTPGYIEFHDRFNAPTADRNIYVIYIGRTNFTESLIFSYVGLSTPCTQSTTEVLDIFYRIQFQGINDPIPVISTDTTVFNKSTYYRSRSFANNAYVSTSERWAGVPYRENYLWGNFNLNPNEWVNMAYNGGRNIMSSAATGIYPYWKRRFTYAPTTSNYIGAAIVKYTSGTSNYTSVLWKATNNDFPYKPIQPIHNHNSNAIAPFLDVNYLATGQGEITGDAPTWINTSAGLPEFYRIDIQKTGNVTGDATGSKYTFRKRKMVGFSGNTYKDVLEYYPLLTGNGIELLSGGHGISDNYYRYEEYSGVNIITSDSTGITLLNITNGDNVIFDAASTPSLPVTSVQQTVADDAGNIYVACKATGLWKISNPLTSPTVSLLTNTGAGVIDTQCYGVTIGYAGKVWALFNGALAQSSDGGVTWTNHNPTSTIPFDYTGITDNNWSEVRLIRADRDSADNELGLMYHDPNNNTTARTTICWWSAPTGSPTGVAFKGPDLANTLISDGGEVRHNTFKCSLRGSYWGGISGANAYKLRFNDTSTILRFNNSLMLNYTGVVFFYDLYGNPYMLGDTDAPYDSSLTGYPVGLWDIDAKHIGASLNLYAYTGRSTLPIFSFEKDGDAKNFYFALNYTSLRILFGMISPYYSSDPLNSEYSPYSEMAWDNYNWNGTAWVKGYHTPAIDTGGSSRDGVRYNFDVESYYFTGRSCIDISAAAPTGTYTGGIMTFAATITPNAKITTNYKQLPGVKLLGVYDKATNTELTLNWRNTDVNVYNGTTTYSLGTTPADDIEYRVVFVINGATVDYYLDGALIGSITMAEGSLDLSNAGGVIDFTLGAQSRAINAKEFFRGTMRNVQLWNGAWTAAEVTADVAAGPYGVITPTGSSGTLIARYELNPATTIDESKPTNDTGGSPPTGEELINGVNVNFINGASGTAFVDTDYYTFGVIDGILKDNAISYTYNYDMYFKPIDKLTSIEDSAKILAGGSAPFDLIPGTGQTITEDVIYRGRNRAVPVKGQISRSDTSNGWQYGANSFQHISGDGYVEFKVAQTNKDVISGLVSTNGTIGSNMKYAFKFYTDGTFRVYENNTVLGTATTFSIGDTFRIERVSGLVTYYVNNVVYITSNNASYTADLWHQVALYSSCSIYDVKMRYDRPAGMMDFGAVSGLITDTTSGKYYKEFSAVDPATSTVSINGSAAVVVEDTSSYLIDIVTSLTAPNSVVVVPDAGLGVFDSVADGGKTVTASYTMVKYR